MIMIVEKMGAACVCEDPVQSRLCLLEDNLKSINNLLIQLNAKSSPILECSVSHTCESCMIAPENNCKDESPCYTEANSKDQSPVENNSKDSGLEKSESICNVESKLNSEAK